MRAMYQVLTVVSAGLLLVGCGKSPSSAPGGGADGLTLGVIPKSTGGEFWETVEEGARAAAADLGVAIKWEGAVSETEVAQQNKIIESMISLGVDGIALAPLNRQAQVKRVQSAVDAGIPVVIFDSELDGDQYRSFIATDNKAGGALAGTHMLEMLGDGQGKRIMVMRFVQGTGSTEARAEGFIETVTAAGAEIVADPYPDTGTPEGSKSAAANTFNRFVKDGALDLDGIFACNLYSSEGVVEALDGLRKSNVKVDGVRVIGFDTSIKLLNELRAERLDALISQNPERMGYLAVETIAKVVRGEEVEPMVDTGVVLVTRDSMDNDPDVKSLLGLE